MRPGRYANVGLTVRRGIGHSSSIWGKISILSYLSPIVSAAREGAYAHIRRRCGCTFAVFRRLEDAEAILERYPTETNEVPLAACRGSCAPEHCFK